MSAPPPAVLETRQAVRGCLSDLSADDLVLVACSGGADSLALAAATAYVAARSPLRAAAVTVDHRLQDGSGERAQRVAAALRGLGLAPVEIATIDVSVGGGPEDAARRARYAALDEVAGRLGAAAVLLGHTLDDQAETVLLRLARGSGARSLAGMRAVSGRYRRPFLGLARATVHAATEVEGLRPWEDPHNADRSFLRPRVRHDVLPALESALGPGVSAALARTADLLRADADALDAWADVVYQKVHEQAVDGPASVDLQRLAREPEAVRTRVLRRAAIAAGSAEGSLTAAHVAVLDAFVIDWHGQGAAALPGGVSAHRACGRLLLGRVPTTNLEETGGR